MTIFSPLHDHFGRLEFALHSTEITNTYHVETYPRFQKSPLSTFLPSPDQDGRRLVQFTASSNEELPHPVILNTHAALAKILHVSGKGEQIDKVMRDEDQLRCMAADHRYTSTVCCTRIICAMITTAKLP